MVDLVYKFSFLFLILGFLILKSCLSEFGGDGSNYNFLSSNFQYFDSKRRNFIFEIFALRNQVIIFGLDIENTPLKGPI